MLGQTMRAINSIGKGRKTLECSFACLNYQNVGAFLRFLILYAHTYL